MQVLAKDLHLFVISDGKLLNEMVKLFCNTYREKIPY